MADQLLQADLLAAVARALPDSYLDPMIANGDGYELLQGFAKSGERVSLAVRNFELDGFVGSAAGASLATVMVTFYRPTDAAGALTVRTGSLVSASVGGQVFRTIADAVFGSTDLEITVAAVSIGFGYEWNIRGNYTDPQGAVWPGELDTILLPLQDPPFTDQTILVRNDNDATGGRPGSLDALGDERNLARQATEDDNNYRGRIRALPDTISPNAIARQLKNYMRPFGLWYRTVETWQHQYQECWDAPDDPPTMYQPYDSNLFCYDDPRPNSPMQNRWLNEIDYLGAFIVEVAAPAAILDYGFCYDDPETDEADAMTPLGIRALSAYDIPSSLAPPSIAGCYDGIDFGINTLFWNLYALLDSIKAGGVYVAIVIQEQG